MLQLKNIAKYHSNGIQKNWVLKDISTTIFEGEFVSIMGPSGAGKSTLLNIIGLLDRPTSGRVVLGGHDTRGLDERGLRVLPPRQALVRERRRDREGYGRDDQPDRDERRLRRAGRRDLQRPPNEPRAGRGAGCMRARRSAG
jgi:energy-coupling factor transporter ATP-binding protein EcfA2